MTAGVVIVGGGQAGFQVAASLRADGYGGSIRLIGAEDHPPYQRPPLSKGLLLGKMERERLLFRQPAFYASRRRSTCGWADRDRDRPGGPCGRPPPPASAFPTTRWCWRPARGCGRCRCRGPSSPASSICARSRSPRTWHGGSAAAERVVVIGGGFIGLEVAAAVRMLGKPVTVLEAADRLMGRVVAPVISAFYAELHRARGVELVLGARIAALEGAGGQVRAVVMADGDASRRRPGRDRHRRPAQRRAGRGRRASPATTASSSTSTGGPAIPRSSPPASAPATPTASPAGWCGWNRCRTRSTRPRPWRPRSWAATHPTTRCRGSGATSTRSSCRWWGSRPGTTARWCAATRPRAGSPCLYFRDGRLLAIDSVNRAGDHMTGRKLLAAGARPEPGRGRRRGVRPQGALGNG